MGAIIRRRSEHETRAWAGGETTELAIFPAGSSYAQRSFSWRVSSATVTIPSSEFTRLEGYYRHLMVLDGELRLLPAGGAEAELAPGDQYSFDGATPIACFGLATDVNLMLAQGFSGRLSRGVIGPGSCSPWQPESPSASHGLAYCYRGQALVSSAQLPSHTISAGDLVWLTNDAAGRPEIPSLNIENIGDEPLIIVLATVFNTP
ncbi:MAG: HutD [Firmicutes bacterium ADurb.Bin506]|jgi:environmental stress-induced protein Ves|nr:MAG: HutD [Firmicutes bacterium ADurb.Bin506]